MIKPEQKGMPYLPYEGMIGIDEYKPTDPDKFNVTVEIGIGQQGVDGTDNYTLNVCTPSWLIEEIKKNGKPIFINGVLLVESYDPEGISLRISEIIRSISGSDWNEYNRKLAKYFNWEFD